MVALGEVRWKLFPGETPLTGRLETTSEVPVTVEAAAPEISSEEIESCAGIVLADLLLISDLSVPVSAKDLVIVRLDPVYWYVADDPAAGRVPPWDIMPVLEASCDVSDPRPERLATPRDEAGPLEVTIAPGCADEA